MHAKLGGQACRETGGALVASLGNCELAVTRFRGDGSDDIVEASAVAEDAFMAIHQFRPFPKHDHWTAGRHHVAPAAPAGAVHIIDLSKGTAARLHAPFDSLHVHIPRAAVVELSGQPAGGAYATLRVPVDWATHDAALSRLAPSLADALDAGSTASSLFVEHLVLASAALLVERYGDGFVPVAGGLAPWQERRAREMIAADLAGGTRLADLAAACGLSSSYFSRAFRRSTGFTPHDWLQRCRVEFARDLLIGSELSLSEIALACGFADQSHFGRVFKGRTGLTPNAWRRRHTS